MTQRDDDGRCHTTGKKRFASKSAARRRMAPRCRFRLGRLHARLSAYFCPDCHGWHLTNPEKR